MSFVTAIGRRVTSSVGVRRVMNAIPVPMSPSGRSGLFSAANASGNVEAQLRAMGNVGTLFAIVDKLATGVAAVEWKLYRKSGDGEDDRTEIKSHPALLVLNKPNSFYTRQELVEAGQQHQDLTGEMWWIIARNPRVNMPAEIWPVRPDKMQLVVSAENFIDGYVYNSPDGTKIPLRREDVIFIRRPNPLDPYRGMGPIQSVLSYIDAEHYSAQWNRNFFLNGAIPGGIIEVENRLSDPEFDKMSARWREQHQGLANAHRVAILEKAKWVDVNYTNKDMQFVELSRLADDKIRTAFGFPKPMLGDTENSNRAVAQAAEYVFARWLIVPRLERIKGAFNNEFLPMFPGSDGLFFDYESPVPEDEEAENAERTSKVNAIKILVDLGFKAEAVLEWADFPALPYSKPAPPPALTGPPPGRGGDGGAGLDPNAPPPDEGDGEDAGQAAARLARFISAVPPGQAREQRIEALRALASMADDARSAALPW